MSQQFLESLSIKQLLQLTGSVIDELRRRGAVRTGNNPLSDYTEFLVAARYGWTLASPSEQGYDLEDTKSGRRYEIKGRRIIKNGSRQLSAIRGIDARHFDALIAVIFDESFEVVRAMEIPWEIVKEHSRVAKHTNSITLFARDSLLKIEGVRDFIRGFPRLRIIKVPPPGGRRLPIKDRLRRGRRS